MSNIEHPVEQFKKKCCPMYNNPSAGGCDNCMKGSPYWFCCRLGCGEHEFCRGCNFVKGKENE